MVLKKKIVMKVPELEFFCQTSTVFIIFQKYKCAFFLTCSVIDRCQIGTDSCEKNV